MDPYLVFESTSERAQSPHVFAELNYGIHGVGIGLLHLDHNRAVGLIKPKKINLPPFARLCAERYGIGGYPNRNVLTP